MADTDRFFTAAANALQQQARFDDFLALFNQERPHEALADADKAIALKSDDVDAYLDSLSHRWANAALGHRTSQVGTDGSVKLLQRIPEPALMALRDGLCHLAGSHLLDPATGDYTLPYFERLLPGRDPAVIRLAHRDQGLIVAPGNPLGLSGIEDLVRPGLRYVNRQRGAGTRVLLDHELARHGIEPEGVHGYEREEHTHLAVAAAVGAGRADCGLGVLAAARAFELDFVPIAREPYDLVLERSTVDDRLLEPLWELLAAADFRQAVDALGGYDTAELGRRIK